MKRSVSTRALVAFGLVLTAFAWGPVIPSDAQSLLETLSQASTNDDSASPRDVYQAYIGRVRTRTANSLRPDPLTVPVTDAVSLGARGFTGVLKEDLLKGTKIPVRIQIANRTDRRLLGTMRFALGNQMGEHAVKLARNGTETVNVDVCSSNLPGRWDALPLDLSFLSEEGYSEGTTMFYYSRTATNAITGDDFVSMPGVTNPCPLTGVVVERKNESRNLYNLAVSFRWNDECVVPATAAFTNESGRVIPTPLDLTWPGGQPCDAVECFFDIRPDAWQARPMADGEPGGVVRVGVYPWDEGGKRSFRYQVEPEHFTNVVKLAGEVGGTCLLELKVQPGGALVGFAMQVTDHDDFNVASGRVFCLTVPPPIGREPVSFIRLGSGKPQLFYRVGE